MLPPQWGHHGWDGIRWNSLYSTDDQAFIFLNNGLKLRDPTVCSTYKCLIDHNDTINSSLLIIQYMDYSQIIKAAFKVFNNFLHKSETSMTLSEFLVLK